MIGSTVKLWLCGFWKVKVPVTALAGSAGKSRNSEAEATEQGCLGFSMDLLIIDVVGQTVAQTPLRCRENRDNPVTRLHSYYDTGLRIRQLTKCTNVLIV